MASVRDPDAKLAETEGRATRGTEIRVVRLDGAPAGPGEEGEIRVRGPHLCSGYVDARLDAEAFDPDGFFRTGDRGELRADGMLKITGRTKELFKTAKGKYVAPAPIENLLNTHPMVEMSIVSGVGQSAAYGLVVLAEQLRPRLGDKTVRAEVEREMTQLLAEINRRLADYEQLRMIVVEREPWTIENGCLTPTMKIKRARIEAAVEPHIEGWYAGGKSVVWA